MMSDIPVDLLQQFQRDREEGIPVLFREYYPRVCNIIYRYVGDKELAEDLAQDVFLKLWQKKDRIKVNTSLKAYISRMASNEAISYLRKHRQLTKVDEKEAWLIESKRTDEGIVEGELAERISATLQALPPKCRQVFLLSRQEELSYREIATRLDISIKTVENQMGKALKIFRESLKGYL